MLDRAALAAMRAWGDAEPNPLVGAVIARDGHVLGIGHHRRYGSLHAERDALANCASRGHDPSGATAYVTLEPCCHVGKQPPCTQALIDAGIDRVVYARPDPGEASGGGADILRSAGLSVEHDPVSRAAVRLSDPFVKRVTTGLPWVIVKWAQTIDGRVATRTGESKWISSPRSRARVHKLRARVDAVLTGSGTAHADDPMLNARGVRRVRRTARRVVLDSDLDLPLDTNLVQTARALPTTIACSKDLVTAGITENKRQALEHAGVEIMGVPDGPSGGLKLDLLLAAMVERHDATAVLVEAGPGLIGSILEAGLADELVVYIAPLMLGDERALSAAVGRVAPHLAGGNHFELIRSKQIDSDIELVYRRAD